MGGLARAPEYPSPTCPQLRVSRRVALLGVAQRRLDVRVAQARADGRQAHPILHQRRRVAVA